MSDTKSVTTQKIAPRDDLPPPSFYKVILLNDDVTTMEFVVGILTTIFQQSDERAIEVMSEVHNDGKAVVASYPYEIAEAKVFEATSLARANGFPLIVEIEPE